MEHLVIFVFEVFLKHVAPELFQLTDRQFQKRIDQGIPEIAELLSKPQRILETPLTVPPKFRIGTALCIGIPIGVLVGGVTVFIAWIEGAAQNKADYEAWFWYGTGIAIPMICCGVVWWLHVGKMTLRIDGVECSVGKTSVLCPWQLFDTPDNPIWHTASAQYSVPINLAAIHRIRQFIGGKQTRESTEVRSTFLRPTSASGVPFTDQPGHAWVVLMSDIYRCPLPELTVLLRNIARKMPPGLQGGVS